MATPDELRDAVQHLLEEGDGMGRNENHYDENHHGDNLLLCELIFHPQMPDDVLMVLCDKGRCISALGYLPGPPQVLECLAEKYSHSEAITTLALSHYAADDYDVEHFAAFLRKHAGDDMLAHNATRASWLSDEKQEVVRQIFEETHPQLTYLRETSP